MANDNSASLLQAQYFGAIFDGEGDGNSDVWDSLWTTPPPFEQLDILIPAFAHTVEENGEYVLGFWDVNPVIPAGPERLKYVVSQARAANPNIKILISLGYGSSDLGNACTNIPVFVASVISFLENYNLDGFDIDYEEFTGLTQELVTEMFDALGTALHAKGYLFSMSPAYGTQYMTSANVKNFNYFFPQTYGGTSVAALEAEPLCIPKTKIFNACHTEGAGSEEAENQTCKTSVCTASGDGLAGVFNWRMDANFDSSTKVWDWGWNAITELNKLCNAPDEYCRSK